jgi:hypothetical protein
MKNLIIPMGGKSSRFPGTRPKWMLTHPVSGSFMCIEAIKGINLEFFERIIFIILKEHDDEYKASICIKKALEELENYESIKENFEIVVLEEPTKSQSETVYEAIHKADVSGFIYIKDSDGYFNIEVLSEDNQIVYLDLNNTDSEINARSKSYIEIDSNNIITNIVEKKVISSKFCVGGYGFNSANEFCTNYEKIKNNSGECYISNVVFQMLLGDVKFLGHEASEFIDWGTIESWNEYKSKIYTLFVDLDGTLITNTSHLCPPFIGEGLPLQDNIDTIKKIKKQKGSVVIITTSRPEKYRDVTTEEIKKYNIPFDVLIMGLPHSQRILINDFALTNPYPSCSAINIRRNSEDLKNYIKY